MSAVILVAKLEDCNIKISSIDLPFFVTIFIIAVDSFSFAQLVEEELDGVVAVVEEQQQRMDILKNTPPQRKVAVEERKKLLQWKRVLLLLLRKPVEGVDLAVVESRNKMCFALVSFFISFNL